MIDTMIWAGVVLILGIITLFMLRKTVIDKIASIARAGKDGVSFVQQPDRVPEPERSLLLCYVDIIHSPISASVINREQLIKNQIQHFSDEEKISALMREFAKTRIDMEFQNISHLIFGSQYLLLERLTSSSLRVSLSQANDLFSTACEKFPEIHKDRTFEHWVGFLTAYSLIEINGDSVGITQYGKDFLKYLIDTNTSYNRVG